MRVGTEWPLGDLCMGPGAATSPGAQGWSPEVEGLQEGGLASLRGEREGLRGREEAGEYQVLGNSVGGGAIS